MHTYRYAVLRISSLDLQGLSPDAELGTPNAESNALPVLMPRRWILNLEISLTHFTTPGKVLRIHKEFLNPDAGSVILAACPNPEIAFTHLAPLNLIHRIMIHNLMLASCIERLFPVGILTSSLGFHCQHRCSGGCITT